MIEFLTQGSFRTRLLAGAGCLLLIIQWWGIPLLPTEWTGKWLWSLDTARGFPAWFQLGFPIFLMLAPLRAWLSPVIAWLSREPSRFLNIVLMTLTMGVLFWGVRVGGLHLGDSRLIMDFFVSLTTYASVREPLESILHTEFARFLFHHYGVHPQTSFQLLSCLWGMLLVVLMGVRLSHWGDERQSYLSWLWLLLLIGPVHLFFGYIEWYTQFAVGLILFEVYGAAAILTGQGLVLALAGLVLACGSHMVGFGFLPAGLFLVCMVLPGRRRVMGLVVFLLSLGVAMALIMFWIRTQIVFAHSVKSTMRLFTTLLPLMSPDNPDNPPGSWHYPWLSPNHLMDLLNEILLCGLFPLILLVAVCPFRELLGQTRAALKSPLCLLGGVEQKVVSSTQTERASQRLILFFLPQLFLGGVFLLIWNPWLGFPTDWDLFSFFAWPLMMAVLVGVTVWCGQEERHRLFWLAGIPAFSVTWAWIVFHHQGSLPTSGEVQAELTGNRANLCWEEAHQAVDKDDWPLAFEKTEAVMAEDPSRITECLELMGTPVVQRMSAQWPESCQVVQMACDMEVISASPTRRLLVMDCWGRIFLWEGGVFQEWEMRGIPGLPKHHATALEIVPWRKSAVILRDDGALYEVPLPGWIDTLPEVPVPFWLEDPPQDRGPHPMGNLFYDYARIPVHPGRKAVDLVADLKNQRLVVLDNTGDLVTDQPGEGFEVEHRAAFINTDVELRRDGQLAFVGDCFGTLRAWPGGESPLFTGFDFYWPAIADYELARGGEEVYVLDVQGGVFPFTRGDKPLIDPLQMRHFSPSGEPEEYTPYFTEAYPFFRDIELVPGEKAYYRMLWTFGIYLGIQGE